MPKKIEELAKPSLRHIKSYVPGKPIQELERELYLDEIIKLASNENPHGPSPKVVEAIRKSAAGVSRYPEGAAHDLKKALAGQLGVAQKNLIITSGSSEAIWLFLEAFVMDGDEIVYPFPSFLIYRILAHMLCAEPVEAHLEPDFSYNLDRMAERIGPKTKVVILCNPNNPTGTIVTRRQLEGFLEKVPENVLILSDEAYVEYVETSDFGSALPYFHERNVLVCRTFSKIYGLAGLRIGYGIAREEIIQLLEKIRPPFNTTSVSQEAATAALGDREYVEKSYANNVHEKIRICRELDRLGVRYAPTEANFIFCDFKKDAAGIVNDLERRGVIIRLLGAFGLPLNYVRITIGTPRENRILVEHLEELLQKA